MTERETEKGRNQRGNRAFQGYTTSGILPTSLHLLLHCLALTSYWFSPLVSRAPLWSKWSLSKSPTFGHLKIWGTFYINLKQGGCWGYVLEWCMLVPGSSHLSFSSSQWNPGICTIMEWSGFHHRALSLWHFCLEASQLRTWPPESVRQINFSSVQLWALSVLCQEQEVSAVFLIQYLRSFLSILMMSFYFFLKLE